MSKKPYQSSPGKFLTSLVEFKEDEIKKALSGYDVRYEFKTWRSLQFADYLTKWLPEVCLKANELVSIDQFNMDEKIKKAIKRVHDSTSIDIPTVVAETILHAVLRHSFESEPIACKLFSSGDEGTRSFGNAHIIHTDGGDELWLGRSSIISANTFEQMVENIGGEINQILEPEILKQEKEILVSLREPQHLLPTDLEDALNLGTPFDDLLKKVCLPVLVAYDSDILGSGFVEQYEDALKSEVLSNYSILKAALPDKIEEYDLRLHVFLIPIESVQNLTQQFSTKIGPVPL